MNISKTQTQQQIHFGNKYVHTITSTISDKEVAHFAKRIMNSDRFNMTSGSTRVLKTIEDTRSYLAKIKDKRTRKIFAKFYDKIISKTTNLEAVSENYKTFSNKFELIDNKKYKDYVLTRINNLTELEQSCFKSIFQEEMDFLETFTDAINILDNKYSNIKSEPREFLNWLKNKNSWFADVIENKKANKNNYRNGYATNKKEKIDFDTYKKMLKDVEDINIPKVYDNDLHLEALKKLAEKYNHLYPDAITLVYKNSYLPKVPAEQREIYLNMLDKYKTLVINSNTHTTTNDLKHIEEELRLWKEAGGDEANLPRTIYIDYLDKSLNEGEAYGNAARSEKRIKLKEVENTDFDGNKYNYHPLRHEITHLNDKNLKPKYDFERLIDWAKWKTFKFKFEDFCRQELKKGNLGQDSIDYGLQDQYELAAITSEADIFMMSSKYIQTLKKWFNLDNWIYTVKRNKYTEQ